MSFKTMVKDALTMSKNISNRRAAATKQRHDIDIDYRKKKASVARRNYATKAEYKQARATTKDQWKMAKLNAGVTNRQLLANERKMKYDYKTKHSADVERTKRAMYGVTQAGTATNRLISDVTGTVQNAQNVKAGLTTAESSRDSDSANSFLDKIKDYVDDKEGD